MRLLPVHFCLRSFTCAHVRVCIGVFTCASSNFFKSFAKTIVLPLMDCCIQITTGIGKKREMEAAKQKKLDEEQKKKRLLEMEADLEMKMKKKLENDELLRKQVCVGGWVCICVDGCDIVCERICCRCRSLSGETEIRCVHACASVWAAVRAC